MRMRNDEEVYVVISEVEVINDEEVTKEVELVVTLHWCPAEPDVGIFYKYFEIADVRYLDGTKTRGKYTDDQIEAAVERAR